jgi:hypothetical protein
VFEQLCVCHCRLGCSVPVGVNHIWVCTMRMYDTLEIRNALVKCVYGVTEYNIFSHHHFLLSKFTSYTCCNCYRDRNDVDVSAVYHQLLDTYKSSDSESDANVEANPGPSCSRSVDSVGTTRRRHHEQQTRRMSRRRPAAPAAIPTDWRRECRDLLEMLWSCEDSTPFRLPFTQHICHKGLLCCY